MTLLRSGNRADAFRAVFNFTFGHWRRQPWRAVAIGLLIMVATATDVFIPVFAGRLVDAVAAGTVDRDLALSGSVRALAVILGLGVVALVLRHLSFLSLVQFTLRIMTDVAQQAFHRVQRFSTDWHANAFAGSTVRRITRGMYALDLLNDTLLLAFLPSAVVLLGTSATLAFYWPVMGGLILCGAAVYVGITAALSLGYVAPAARLANRWDTRVGGALADAVSCNGVVKAFGAEAREDRRLAGLIGKWSDRTRRTWKRGTVNGTTQNAMLLLLRGAIIAAALGLWWTGRATPGDVTYVLTTFFIIQGYLREVGMHIRNLQRSVNDMEELVDLHRQPLGVTDPADATPLRVSGGEVVFDRVNFHYGSHANPLYSDLS
ncbi:MAG TPA: ABC transporter ATP-binding protein, partial [Myxococcaceae bacterium]|nr:ABC transporter ATP-binding protein [Myxococcaceae bacterium]